MALPVLTIFGATGATGKYILKHALESKQFTVRAYARSPTKIPADATADPNFQLVTGDFENTEKIAEAVQGAKYVVAAVGNAAESNKGPYMVPFVKKLIAACEAAGIERIVYQAGMLSPKPGEKLSFGMKLMKATVARMVGIIGMINENDEILEMFSKSKLKFAVSRPGMIVEKPSKGTLKGSDSKGGSVTFVDLAEFNFKAVQSGEYDGQYPFVTY